MYGISLGIAERVLQGAQLHMPPELHERSTVYWISPTGDLGSGPSAAGISDLSSGPARRWRRRPRARAEAAGASPGAAVGVEAGGGGAW